MQSVRARILTLPRGVKQSLMIAADAAAYILSVVATVWIIYGSVGSVQAIWILSLVAVLVAVPVLWLFGLYASIIRFMGLELFRVGFLSTLTVVAILVALDFWTNAIDAPLRSGVIFWALSLILVIGGRFVARSLLIRRNQKRESVIVYGAGIAGAQLISNILAGDDYLPVVVVDDDKKLQGQRVHGLRVKSPQRLPDLVDKYRASSILLAIPSATRRARRRVLEDISQIPVRVQTVPDVADIIAGKARIDDLSAIDVADLLGRNSIPPNTKLLSVSIAGKNVMVTGAGGSIGSELCRQILMQRPKRLVLFEISEPALYEIDRQLHKLASKEDIQCEITALLGSVQQQSRVREVMDAFKVQTVYHAAAYKHVPIVEQNLIEGISNNVIGTWRMVQAAIDAGVQSFVLVSTDKAVNPTSVMGATKRLAELILQAYQKLEHGTCFSMVRFGNVLESSGSVVPLFEEQIRNGGPVTVTHRDIVRYFMTIPEAAQLVIQAGAMAEGGDVFVLDMGEPVRIDDLARRMISLMGLTVRDKSNPDGDIDIAYIGLRPAEKLYEELLIGANSSGTGHPRIMRADEHSLPYNALVSLIEALQSAIETQDRAKARELLVSAVREYSPASEIEDLVWSQRTGTDPDARSGTILNFPIDNG
jgi:FlaA1/EpsC-like NDP-sugar epimerase